MKHEKTLKLQNRNELETCGRMNRNDYMVLVNCMTFNQSKYILDALNGFVMQKTNFPFVCLVMDDASTDGEQEVIRGFLNQECAMESAEFSEIEEANVVVVPHKTNLNCTMAVYFLKKNLYGTGKKTPLIAPWRERCKYEAMCEGDDYWIDSEKLQKQFDILEKMPDISLCFHNVFVKEPNGEIVEDYITQDIPGRSSIENLVKYNYIHTPSVMYRSDMLIIEDQQQMGQTYVGDYVRWMLCASRGDLYKLSDTMAVYRNGCGFWSSQDCLFRDIRWIVMLAKIYPFFDIATKKTIDKRINENILSIERYHEVKVMMGKDEIRNTCSYKMGHILIWPFSKMKKIILGSLNHFKTIIS